MHNSICLGHHKPPAAAACSESGESTLRRPEIHAGLLALVSQSLFCCCMTCSVQVHPRTKCSVYCEMDLNCYLDNRTPTLPKKTTTVRLFHGKCERHYLAYLPLQVASSVAHVVLASDPETGPWPATGFVWSLSGCGMSWSWCIFKPEGSSTCLYRGKAVLWWLHWCAPFTFRQKCRIYELLSWGYVHGVLSTKQTHTLTVLPAEHISSGGM